MRIGFVTGSLAPGKTGVGDYTRLLAAECLRRGGTCRLLALAEPEGDSIEQEQGALQVLRLPRTMGWPERIAAARRFLTAGDIEWLSFQFVAYSYHPKGIPNGLAEVLAPLFAGYRQHWMFHELWLGQYRGAVFKERLIGWLQRRAILGCVKRLPPTLVHTSNPAYVRCLEQVGVRAHLLPLFGAVAVAPPPGPGAWIHRAAEALGLPGDAAERRNWWVFGMFGSLRPEWPCEPLFSRLAAAGRRAGRLIAIASIGRLSAGEPLWQEMVGRYPDFRFLNFGPQSAEHISEYLQWLDWGIAGTPWQLLGKSSTAVAMLEHGLPVIVNRDDVQFTACGGMAFHTDEPLLYRMGADLEEYLARGPQKGVPGWRLGAVAAQFLGDLQKASAQTMGAGR